MINLIGIKCFSLLFVLYIGSMKEALEAFRGTSEQNEKKNVKS